jgi:hypothetical protein
LESTQKDEIFDTPVGLIQSQKFPRIYCIVFCSGIFGFWASQTSFPQETAQNFENVFCKIVLQFFFRSTVNQHADFQILNFFEKSAPPNIQ